MQMEKDFQAEANEAGERFAETAKEMIDTLRKAEAENDDAADEAREAIEPISAVGPSSLWMVQPQRQSGKARGV